ITWKNALNVREYRVLAAKNKNIAARNASQRASRGRLGARRLFQDAVLIAIEEFHARRPQHDDEDRTRNEPAHMRPPRDFFVGGEGNVQDLHHDPETEYPFGREMNGNSHEGEHPYFAAWMQHQISRDDARDRAGGTEQRQM